jgi:hypothetical protein
VLSHSSFCCLIVCACNKIYEQLKELPEYHKRLVHCLLSHNLYSAALVVCACSKFYDRLKELREYHKRFPVYDISAAEDDSSLLKEEPKLDFSGEEGLGR